MREGTDGPAGGGERRRPVILATLSVRVSAAAERMAIDSALEAGSPLIIANMLALRPYATTIMLLGPGAATLPSRRTSMRCAPPRSGPPSSG